MTERHWDTIGMAIIGVATAAVFLIPTSKAKRILRNPSITTTDHKKGALSTPSCRPSTRLTALLTCFPRSGLRPKTDQIEEASL